MPLPDMITKIKEASGLSDEDIKTKIDAKCTALSGLISKEGAAHIIANELGIKLVESNGKIKDLLPGMRNIQVLGRVTQVYEIREFQRADGTPGKVGNFLLGDETGSTRIVCWGKHADILNELSPGTPVKVMSGQVRENRGYAEVHLNDYSKIQLNPEEHIPEVAERKIERKQLNELQENGQEVEVMGTVVQLFDPKYFETCPQCSTRLKDVEGQWSCGQHGTVEPDYSYLVNVFLDDGTENMRVVLFRNQAEQLLSKTKEDMLNYRLEPANFEPLKTELLGEQFKFIGRAKRNTFFDRIEFIANKVYKANPEEEIARIENNG